MREVLTYRLSDGTKITLRPATPDDAAGIIAAVRSRSDERSYVLMEIYGKDAATERAYLERLDRSRNLFLVATVDDAIVGILALLDRPLCSGATDSLAAGVHLLREWRGRGIGSALLRYAVRWAVTHGFKRIEADIFTANERSLHLFRKSQFREEPCHRRSVQVGAREISEVILTRRLPASVARA
ncbi:MAG TPA: GNAT family N-acetyltransferase [Candidatus Methanoperedens sp.]|nr:GNAT family N-acetyltransferase [Candidatus Methanoperedens sp.]